MTTLLHAVTFDEEDLMELTQILEKSKHCSARRLLDKLWRNGRTSLGSCHYELPEINPENDCGK